MDDPALLSRIAGGDQAAFEVLFREWYGRLVLFAERYQLPAGESEEIVSEAFLKCWQLRSQFDALPKIKSFLYTAVRNASLNAVRKQQTHATQVLGENVPGDQQPPGLAEQVEVIRAEVSGALFAEIEKLEGRAKEVILLTYREGLSSHQIAERLGISASTVNSHRSRAIAQLRIALADRYPLLSFALIAVLLEKLF